MLSCTDTINIKFRKKNTWYREASASVSLLHLKSSSKATCSEHSVEITSHVACDICQKPFGMGVDWVRQCTAKPLILRHSTLLFTSNYHPLTHLFS